MNSRLSITVDLGAIANNWRQLNSRLGAGHCGAVVKANAYGLGAKQVAVALARAGCHEFFVANLNEGIALRSVLLAAGFDPAIYVLQGLDPHAEAAFSRHRLTPVLVSLDMVQAWLAYSQCMGSACLPCAIKLNTGMNRLGLECAEAEALCASSPELWLPTGGAPSPLLVSHLACADEPHHPLNAVQLANFTRVLAAVRAINPRVRGSLANSSGIFLGPEYCFEVVRPGAALYGLNPTPLAPNPMQNVLYMALPILQLRSAAAGCCVGYGAELTLARPSRLAVVAGGYADGIFRASLGRMQGWVGGTYVPLVGRVSMDALVFDVTDVPALTSSDQIEILGEHISADQQGIAAGTIGYEVLTRLGERVRRTYKGLNLMGDV